MNSTTIIINIINLKYEKIMQYVTNPINGSIKNGNTIKFLASYVDRAIGSIEQTALFKTNKHKAKSSSQKTYPNIIHITTHYIF